VFEKNAEALDNLRDVMEDREDQQREADDVMKEMVNNDEDEEYNDEYFDQLGKETHGGEKDADVGTDFFA
jgi:hypothetical protein